MGTKPEGRGMILSIEGPEASGKTTLAYTAPLPIVGFSFDISSERALFGSQYNTHFANLGILIETYKKDMKIPDKLPEEDILVYELPEPVQLDQTKLLGFAEIWKFFIGTLTKAAMDSRVKTIVIDTMTLARRVKADAYLQELQAKNPDNPRKQLLQLEYGHPNDSIRGIYTLLGGLKKNLVVIHHETDERTDYIDKDGTKQSMLTGKKILEGLPGTHRYVDVALKTGVTKGEIHSTYLKCGYNLSLVNDTVPNPTWNSITNQVSMSLGGRIKFEQR